MRWQLEHTREIRIWVSSPRSPLMSLPRALCLPCAFVAVLSATALADTNLVVSAGANPSYTQRKFEGAEVKPESYVIGEGSFFGGITADRSLDRMSFRAIAESLAPELARQQYWPAKDLASADLLIVVHWGVTTPHQSTRDALDVTTLSFDPRDTPHVDNAASDALFKDPSAPIDSTGDPAPADIATSLRLGEVSPSFDIIERLSEEASQNYSVANNAQLLGYTRALRQLGSKAFGSAEEAVLRADLSTERYLLVLCAYDLKTPLAPGQRRRPAWVTHMNVRAAGTNFPLAVRNLGHAGANFFGRSTDAPTTVNAKMREGRATPGPLIILGMDEPVPPKKK
jgi:hypothetical protein